MFDFLKSPAKIEIKLDKTNFNPGEKISGIVVLEMKDVKDARSLWIRFYGEQKVKKPSIRRDPKTGQTRQTTTTSTETIYENKIELDGEHPYSGTKEYPFEMDIPTSNTSISGESAQVIQTAMTLAKTMGANIPNPPKWYLEADLDVPRAKDANKKIQVNIPGLLI